MLEVRDRAEGSFLIDIECAGRAIEALVCGYPFEWRRKKWLVMLDLQACVDDSGGDSTSEQILVIAAYVMPAAKWGEFANQWEIELAHSPKINYFKMKEAEGLSGEFIGWKKEMRDLKVNELASVIKRYEPRALYCWLSRNNYKNIFRGNVPKEIDNPYFIAMQGVIHLMLLTQQRYGYAGPVDFIFDIQDKIKNQIIESYDYARSKSDPEIQKMLSYSSPVFRDDKQFNPIQAADMLAWHLRRRIEFPKEERPIIHDLLKGGFGQLEIDVESMKALLKRAVSM